jgi:AraC-like DNA-binding protein
MKSGLHFYPAEDIEHRMPDRKPIYHARRASYEIDHCEPQHRAIQSGKIDFHALTKGHYLGTSIPQKVLPGLSNIGFWNAGGNQDWGLDLHRNEGIEIMFLETGSMAFVADRKAFKLRAGNFTITRPWQIHKLGAPNIGPGRLHWLILDVGVRRPHQQWRWPKWLVLTKDDLAELTRLLRHNENPVWNATPGITRSFRELACCVAEWNQPHAVSRLAANVNLLLVAILDTLAHQPLREDKELTSPRRTVEIFLNDLESARIAVGNVWTLDSMAEHCGMGKSTLSKYCLELANVGPVTFLNRCRLEHAARQLRAEKTLSVTEIALSSGFNSSQYFATAFARRFKLSPSDYRSTN